MFIPKIFLAAETGSGSGPVDETAQDLADISSDVGDKKTDESEDDEEESEETDSEEGDEDDETSEEVEASEETEEAEETEDDEDEEDEEDRESKRLPKEPDDGSKETPPSVRAIKEKYPNFFKEFPGLRAAFFEHPKYQEIFPDVDSAANAARKAEEFDALENSLVDHGDPSTLFKVLAENNPKSLRKIISSIPDAVRNVDEQAYNLLVQPIIEELLYHANAHGQKIGNKNLQLSARHLANFVFANGGDIPDIAKRLAKKEEPSEAELELAKERQIYAREKFSGAMEEIGGYISTEMNRFLDHKLEGLSGFEKKQVIKETRLEIDRMLSKDKGFQNVLSGLWKRARETGYTPESKSRLKRAWLDRARLIAPKIRAKYKQEALSGRSSDSKSEGTTIKVKRQFPEKSGSTPNQSGQRTVLDPKKIDWRKTSDMDILNSK